MTKVKCWRCQIYEGEPERFGYLNDFDDSYCCAHCLGNEGTQAEYDSGNWSPELTKEIERQDNVKKISDIYPGYTLFYLPGRRYTRIEPDYPPHTIGYGNPMPDTATNISLDNEIFPGIFIFVDDAEKVVYICVCRE